MAHSMLSRKSRTAGLGSLARLALPARRGALRELVLPDPRHFQIVALSAFLVVGIALLDFPVSALVVAFTLSSALATQAVASRIVGIRFDARSPLITSMSLLLILRVGDPRTMAFAAAIAIGSKFALRVRRKQVFNPANLGIVVAVLCTNNAWISPGQWGNATLLLVLVGGLGLVVTTRARRADITIAFLLSFSALLIGRALWLGDPLAIPLRSLQSGTLLLFGFFMISDPMTTPSSRAGRVLFASWVAVVSMWITFGLHQPNAFLFALAASMPLVPILDRLVPGALYQWRRVSTGRADVRPLSTQRQYSKGMNMMRIQNSRTHAEPNWRLKPGAVGLAIHAPIIVLVLLVVGSSSARAFCGFYVAKADTGLFNKASQVVLVRDGDRTVITMSNDFRGEATEFAMVIPVPTLLEKNQIHVAERAVIDHLDAYTSPRLVEYFDQDPCQRRLMREDVAMSAAARQKGVRELRENDLKKDLGVTIEARYTVGEYDILILSAEESNGLQQWLLQSGYRLPNGAARVLGSYLKQGMRFFVAKVNLEEQARLGFTALRPLQIAFESRKFMLPIRLGTLNADGDQELFVYTLTRKGRVETTNYRTIRLPSGTEVPSYVKAEFGDFYRDLFAQQVEQQPRGVFLEYAWDMGWCDPCAADPLSPMELRQLGVFWVDGKDRSAVRSRPVAPQAQNVFVTRLHLRYNSKTFPEDLRFQETADRSNFQGRYVLRHAFRGRATCSAAESYYSSLEVRLDREAQQLASLTGWDIARIREKVRADHAGLPFGADGGENGADNGAGKRWWERLWPGQR